MNSHNIENANEIKKFNQRLVEKNPAETEFHQAVQEFTESVIPFVAVNQKYRDSHTMRGYSKLENLYCRIQKN